MMNRSQIDLELRQSQLSRAVELHMQVTDRLPLPKQSQMEWDRIRREVWNHAWRDSDERKQLDLELRREQLWHGAARQFEVMPPKQAKRAWKRLWRQVRDQARDRTGLYNGTRLLWEQMYDEG